jgi:hypothetical protein
MNASRFGDSRYWVSGFPKLVREWDQGANGALTPDEVPSGSGRRVQWRCSAGPDHVWRASPNNRTSGTGCPFCANRRVSVTNSLAVIEPAIAAQWHAEKNGVLTPHDVVATSTRVCHWICARDARHEWRASVRDRTRDKTACPYCANRRTSDTNSLATTHPLVAAEWDEEANAPLRATDARAGSSMRAYWRCRANPNHVWRASIANRVRRASGCPFCASGSRLSE